VVLRRRRGIEIKTQAEPGRPGQISFVADRDGAFHYRCAVPCGNLHPFMIGKLVVGPNLTWLRAVAASLLATAGALVVFWRW
jgi:heme/copper-type cytochrome/quinol oxidase subunit 2